MRFQLNTTTSYFVQSVNSKFRYLSNIVHEIPSLIVGSDFGQLQQGAQLKSGRVSRIRPLLIAITCELVSLIQARLFRIINYDFLCLICYLFTLITCKNNFGNPAPQGLVDPAPQVSWIMETESPTYDGAVRVLRPTNSVTKYILRY